MGMAAWQASGTGLQGRDDMGVNVYAEEMTDRIEILSKELDGSIFTGVRFYLWLPSTADRKQFQDRQSREPPRGNRGVPVGYPAGTLSVVSYQLSVVSYARRRRRRIS